MQFLLLLLLIWTNAAQTPDECPQLLPRLTVNEWARVTYNSAINLRPDPSTTRERLGVVDAGTTVKVLDGSVCSGGFRWWQIELPDGLSGWVAEGSDTPTDNDQPDYWLEPRGILETDDDGYTYVVDDEGAIIERADCLRPPDDYELVEWGYSVFNRRTVVMLEQADRIYQANGGTVRMQDKIVQGSYNIGVVASFGTHDGGGAVDISVRSPIDFSIMTDEIPILIDALRTAGFAAWVRRPDELYAGSAIHIHAIAVGDDELSEVARGQIDGEFGYLRGYNGLPQTDGKPPIADADGEPIICQWMIDAGFEDLREKETQ